ncbi:hypothetical protein BJX68DRAFT_231167 [Aspergillus pseudodeflectus]|uniref:Uncharacterized protein n=1 Tax=Aspergillus pseudodeflectus TaxID=176178 RepID=A0ABR4KU47_9EURO
MAFNFNWLSNEKSRMNEEPPNYAEATASTNPSPSPSPLTTQTGNPSTTNNASAVADARAPLKGHDTKYAMLSIAGSDRIRLLRFPEPMTALVSEIVQGLWPKGIQKVQKFDESLELKLKGNPFAYGVDEEKVAIRITLMGILNAFSKEGWVVPRSGGRIGRLGNYGNYGQKDSLIFQHAEPRAYSWLSISFDSADLLHLINAPTELASALIFFFGERIERCNKDFVSGNFELKFTGSPWNKSSGKGSVQSRILILDLMQCLEEQGYTMATSLDIDNGSGGNTYQSYGELWFWYR